MNIIFSGYKGSTLHGSEHEKSDLDIISIFIPSLKEIFTIEPMIEDDQRKIKVTEGSKNSKGDIDHNFVSLRVFFTHLMQGQSNALEMLYAHDGAIISRSKAWDHLVANRHLFKEVNIAKVIGFAGEQMKKASKKIVNLDKILELKKAIDALDLKHKNIPVKNFIEDNLFLGIPVVIEQRGANSCIIVNDKGADINASLALFYKLLSNMQRQYGDRIKGAHAEGEKRGDETSVDYKSLSHAYRVLDTGIEFISTGHITLPRPNGAELRELKLGNLNSDIYLKIIEEKMIILKELEAKSTLGTSREEMYEKNKPILSKLFDEVFEIAMSEK